MTSALSPHWRVMEPLIAACAPRTLLEVGVFAGDTTTLLLDYAARHQAVVHAVDTVIRPELEELAERHGDRLVLHRGPSLTELPRVGPVDVAILDGDHNWYTVLHELRILRESAASAGRALPLIFLHDIGWPYGRRDQYHDPEAIPAADRHPHRMAGIVPGETQLSETAGIAGQVHNAEVEGGPRNGVLTGVEDFLSETPVELTLYTVTGFHGLGILVSGAALAANEDLRAALAELDSPVWLEEQCRVLEEARVEMQAKAATLRRRLRGSA